MQPLTMSGWSDDAVQRACDEAVPACPAGVSCIKNAGPGQVGPSTPHAALTGLQTWVCTFAMLPVRPELFTLLGVLTPVFWRK